MQVGPFSIRSLVRELSGTRAAQPVLAPRNTLQYTSMPPCVKGGSAVDYSLGGTDLPDPRDKDEGKPPPHPEAQGQVNQPDVMRAFGDRSPLGKRQLDQCQERLRECQERQLTREDTNPRGAAWCGGKKANSGSREALDHSPASAPAWLCDPGHLIWPLGAQPPL